MKLVIIESPFFNKNPKQQEYNILYARECMKECLYNNEAPYLSHLLYTQVLDDNILQERNFGIEAGFEFRKVIHNTIVYTDLGISSGMAWGIENAIKQGNTVEYRTLKNFEEFKEKNKNLLEVNIVNITLSTPDVNTFKNSNQTIETLKEELKRNTGRVFTKLQPNIGFLSEEDILKIVNDGGITKYNSDHSIEIIYNKLFGNPEYDSFMKLQPVDIKNIRDYIDKKDTLNLLGDN